MPVELAWAPPHSQTPESLKPQLFSIIPYHRQITTVSAISMISTFPISIANLVTTNTAWLIIV